MMRIEKIILKNYRQYQDDIIDLSKTNSHDLHIFIGKNGVGKTNFLNAINWCLYNDEPHLSSIKNQQPIVNKKTAIENQEDAEIKVSVELFVSDDDNKRIRFLREKIFQITDNPGRPRQIKENFKVILKDEKNNDNFIENKDEVESYVNRFVPFDIREHFFFDGEHLENYFRDTSGAKIQKEIMQISQIGTLLKMEERLTKISAELRRSVGKSEPNIDQWNHKLVENENNKGRLEKQLEDNTKQENDAQKRLTELNGEIGQIPDISELESRRTRIIADIDRKNGSIKSKIDSKNTILFEKSMPILLNKAIDQTLKMILEKKNNDELPPKADIDDLAECISKKFCKFCGRTLDEEAAYYINDLTKQISFSSKVAAEMVRNEHPLKKAKSDVSVYKDKMYEINNEIKGLNEELKLLQEDFDEVNNKYETYNKPQIKNLQAERSSLEKQLPRIIEEKGKLKQKIEQTKSEIDRLKDKLQTANVKSAKDKKIHKKSNVCQDAAKIVGTTRIELLDHVRKRIEEETNKKFNSDLIWKKETFDKVHIDSDYSVSLTDKQGTSMLGTVGKAENELLALAFTLALHEVSGFDAPLLIDTPVARVSDEQRENFGKELRKISEKKQTILLFTNDEYTDNIRNVLQSYASNIFRIEMASDELTTSMVDY